MKTLKQQFNSAASGAIVHLRGRERALEGFGWEGRQAEWIALACLHGGVFTRAQWTSFLGCHHEKVHRAVRALVAQGVAVEEDPPGIDGIGRVCRIHARRIYRALGAGNRRRRRITSTEVLMRRLLSLDYVLDHSRLPWLPTEPEKVAAFEALGIERPLLPQRVYRGAAGTSGATSRSGCRSRWTPGAPFSSTSIRATRQRRHSAPGARRTANSGRRSGIAAAGSRS